MKGIMDAGNARGMLRAGILGKIINSGRFLAKMMNKEYKESGRKRDIKGMMNTISSMYGRRGMDYTKDFLKDHYGFTQRQVDKGLVWDPDTKRVHIRGSIKDTLDYEFYGVPQGTWPNARRLRSWVMYRVIPRDPGLAAEYNKMTRKGKSGMATELTFLFGRAIARDGLKRRSTTKFEKTDDPKMLEQGITVVYKGNKITNRQLTEEEALGKYLPKTAGKASYGNKGLKREFR
jgi:hypothetical protein